MEMVRVLLTALFSFFQPTGSRGEHGYRAPDRSDDILRPDGADANMPGWMSHRGC
jgi:hypothetical protein